MEEPERKRTRVGRAEWAKRVERWRDSGLTTAGFAAELGISPKSLAYWAWALKREASGEKRKRPSRNRPRPASAPAGSAHPAAFVELPRQGSPTRFELEVRGRRLHIPSSFDEQQLRSLLAILESA